MKESPWKRKRLKFHHRFCFFNSNNNTNKCLETQILRLIKTRNNPPVYITENGIYYFFYVNREGKIILKQSLHI